MNGPEADRDQLLTADDVAELMRVTRAWVYAETRYLTSNPRAAA